MLPSFKFGYLYSCRVRWSSSWSASAEIQVLTCRCSYTQIFVWTEDSSELRTSRRGSTFNFQHSPGAGPQLEPATSTFTRSHAAMDQSRDAATQASELLGGSRGSVGPEAAHRQKEMGCPEAAASQPTDQVFVIYFVGSVNSL